MPKTSDLLSADHSSDELEDQQFSKSNLIDSEDDFLSDDENESVLPVIRKPSGKPSRDELAEEEEQIQDLDAEDDDSTDVEQKDASANSEAMIAEQKKRSVKLKKLTPEQLAKEQKRISKTGVCYLSSIPPYMKPAKVRSVLSKYGKLDRIYLKPEDDKSYTKRKKYGGNKKRKFTEGWVEFEKKKEAKLCAQHLNGNILGGKKSSYYHDDIINIKYLSGFKWSDLTGQIARESDIRQAKLALEIAQQLKLNKTFARNVEKSQHMNRKRKRAEAEGQETAEPEHKRTFDQSDIVSTRANAKSKFKKEEVTDNLQNVLLQVF